MEDTNKNKKEYFSEYYKKNRSEILKKQAQYKKKIRDSTKEEKILIKVVDMLDNMNTMNKQIYKKSTLNKYNIYFEDGKYYSKLLNN